MSLNDNKLAPKYYGPYKMLQRIGSLAYELELLPTSHVHPLFHVSFLKKAIGDNISAHTILPKIDEKNKLILELETIMEKGIKKIQY